jgi:hypothetical protein
VPLRAIHTSLIAEEQELIACIDKARETDEVVLLGALTNHALAAPPLGSNAPKTSFPILA